MIEGPALGIRFDTARVESAAYGLESWEIFWRAVDPVAIEGAQLFDGDSAATLAREESVFLIGVQADPAVLRVISTLLGKSERFWQIAASPPFIDEAVRAEPLVEAGRVLAGGELEGGMWSRSAFDTVRREGLTRVEGSALCPNCHSEVEGGDRFCMICGNALLLGTPTTVAASTVDAPVETRTLRRNLLRLPVIVGGAVVLALALGLAVFAGALRGDDPISTSTTTLAFTVETPSATAPTTTQPAAAVVTAGGIALCLVESGLEPTSDLDDPEIGDIIGASGVASISISPGSTALILTYESQERAENAASFFEGTALTEEAVETDLFNNVLVFYEAVPTPLTRKAIESCATGGGPITVEASPLAAAGPMTVAQVESCLVAAGLGPITSAGNVITPAQGETVVIERAEASAVPISSSGKALIFTYESQAVADDAVSYIMTSGLDDFERSQLGNVVVIYEVTPDPDIRQVIEGCAAGAGSVAVEAPPDTTSPSSGLAELDTEVGVVLVVGAYTTDEYPEGCESDSTAFDCTTSPEDRIVVLLLEPKSGSFTEAEADILVDEAFGSFLVDGAGFTVDSYVVTWFGSGTITEPIEVAYIFITADLPTTLELHWPGHDPVDLSPLIES